MPNQFSKLLEMLLPHQPKEEKKLESKERTTVRGDEAKKKHGSTYQEGTKAVFEHTVDALIA